MSRTLLQRDTEMSSLVRHLGEIRAGAGRVVVVEGPAGIGKSSLLTALARTAAASGVTVLRAWGSPLECDAGWGIARQLFTPLRGTPEWEALSVGAAALASRALDPDAAEPALGGDALHAATHGLTWLSCGLADDGPTLLVVDDVQWADAPSLRWLATLARQLPDLRLGVVCAVRSGEPGAAPELLAHVLAAAPAPPVRPRPLGVEAAQALVAERFPDADDAFAHACHSATAGNPFLLGALLDQLVAEQAQPSGELAARLSAFGPEQVARSVERQLSRLPSGATALARALAVLGRSAPLRQAAELAELAPDDASRLADLLSLAGLLDGEGGHYGLVHPLVAAALYGGLQPGERAHLHRQAARALSREGADPEAVALHALRTERSRDPSTVHVLREAAARASARGAAETAVALLRRALAEPPPDRGLEATVRVELGLALAALISSEAVDVLTGALELADAPEQRARIALSGARALGLAGYFDQAVDLCRRGLRPPLDRDLSVPELIELELVGDAVLHAADVPEAQTHLRERQMAAKAPSPLWGLHLAWQAVCDARPADEPRGLLRSVLDSGELQQHTDSILGTELKFLLIACEELDEAVRQCDQLVDLARSRGWLIALAHGSFMRSFALVQAGRIRDAEADARFSFTFKVEHSPPSALTWSLFPLVDALTELGDLQDADAVLTAAARRGEPRPDALATALLLERRGRLRLAQHRPTDAHDDLLQAADCWTALDIRHPGIAAWRVDDGEALIALGDVAAARTRAEEHLQLAQRLGLPGPHAAGLRALARTCGADEAVTLLEQALDLLDGSAAGLERTRVLVELGAALRRANRRGAARDPLARALAHAERSGMRLLADRSRRELLAAGARPRRSALSGVEALTPTEHQVATLAARGRSNREIAQELFVARRTVETHLTHVFQKLGLSTRAELGHLLAGHPEPAGYTSRA